MMSTSLGTMPEATSSALAALSKARLCTRRRIAISSTALFTGMYLCSFCITSPCMVRPI